MELLYWGHGKKEKIGTFSRVHKHDFCQFEIIFCGTRNCQSENKIFKLHRGEIIFIPANVSHRFVDTSSDLEYFSFICLLWPTGSSIGVAVANGVIFRLYGLSLYS